MQKYSLFIGIDISKKWFDAALCYQGNTRQMPHAQFKQTLSGYKSFVKWVKRTARKAGYQGKWIICMEHTGIYALRFCQFLDEANLSYVLDNPLRIKRSLGLRRGKNDKADSMAIAEYAYRHCDELKQRRALPNRLLLKLQALLSLRARLVKYQQGLLVASKELVTCVDTDISQLVSIPSEQVTATMKTSIKDIMKQVKTLIESDESLKKTYQLIHSVIGIGPVIAAYLLVYTNGFEAFQNARQFASYIGIVPFDDTSGISTNRAPEVSPIANKRLKALLSNAAVTAIQHDPQIKTFFDRQLLKGKEEGWIYNAVKNKLVHRVFKVVKRGTPYVKFQH